MDRPELLSGGRASPRKELQGPRPAPLKVSKESYKIKKPPMAPQLHQYPSAASNQQQQQQPVVIYTVSPKVIHTTANDFMNLVQRLTGPSPPTPSASGDVSPAARLASVEKIRSPSPRPGPSSSSFVEREREEDTDMIPRFGILSPEPGNLLPVSLPGLFSPAPDPFLYGNNMYLPSPSFLLSSPIISPSFSSSYDLFNSFFEP